MSRGIEAIVLAPFDPYWFGAYHTAGVIKLFAWPRDLHIELVPEVYARKRELLDLIDVEREEVDGGYMLIKPTATQVVAIQLLGTFVHELGHHVDRMTSKKRTE